MHVNRKSKGNSLQRLEREKALDRKVARFVPLDAWKAQHSKSYKDVYGRLPRRLREGV